MPPKLKRLDAALRRDPEARTTHEEAIHRRRKRIVELAREHGTKWCL
jgi:hypothetical protein